MTDPTENILELNWIAQTWVSCIADRFFTDWATRDAHVI